MARRTAADLVRLAPGYEHPGDPASPTTPTDTDGRLGAGYRHRRHEDRRRVGGSDGRLGHHVQLPTPDGDAEAI